MKKIKKDSQGVIIDEVRKARRLLWRQYRGDIKKLHVDSRKISKALGMKYGSPKKKKNGEEVA